MNHRRSPITILLLLLLFFSHQTSAVDFIFNRFNSASLSPCNFFNGKPNRSISNASLITHQPQSIKSSTSPPPNSTLQSSNPTSETSFSLRFNSPPTLHRSSDPPFPLPIHHPLPQNPLPPAQNLQRRPRLRRPLLHLLLPFRPPRSPQLQLRRRRPRPRNRLGRLRRHPRRSLPPDRR
ncbi:hypothetical protein LINGRAHAP2_LOCUS16012 [Linum grandiflorum]